MNGLSTFAESVVIGKVSNALTDIEVYLIQRLIDEEKRADDQATNISVSGNLRLFRWFEDEVTSNDLMSHKIKRIVSYGMAEMMRP